MYSDLPPQAPPLPGEDNIPQNDKLCSKLFFRGYYTKEYFVDFLITTNKTAPATPSYTS